MIMWEDTRPRPHCRKWHVLWQVVTFQGDFGLTFDHKRLDDHVLGGFETKEEAAAYVRAHRRHRYLDAFLFSARTGMVERIGAEPGRIPASATM